MLDNRYLLERFIGSGSFGEVWVATDKATDLEVAVKIYVAMDDQGLSDFKKEFQITFDFNHTNLLHANYLGVNTDGRSPYLVMPYCPDGSVSKYAGQMSEDELWHYIKDVSAGLAYLHAQNPPVIHQDIKPDNILILKDGTYVITDFGISRRLRSSLRKSANNNAGSAGSISYMGPERFSKQYQAVKASDIWSLGVSIYELAVGDLPFCGMGGSLQKRGADLPELSDDDFSPTLNMVMQSCLAKEPWNRPTAAQLSDYASRVLMGETPPPTWGRRVEPLTAPAQPEVPVQQAATATIVAGQYPPPFQGGQMPPQYPGAQVPPQYPPVSPAGEEENVFGGHIPDAKPASLPAWVWILTAIAGLAVGFLVKLFL